MSITTNYKFKNAAEATVDIGTIFCDLTNDQTVAGAKYFSGTTTTNQINVKGANVLNFGSDVTKGSASGKIGYGSYSPGYLDIVGAGTGNTDRLIKMSDIVDINGRGYVATPPSDSNDTSISTTNWVRNLLGGGLGSIEIYEPNNAFIDFKNTTTSDLDARIILARSGDLNIYGVKSTSLGGPNTYAVTPGGDSNNTEIATTAWVRGRGYITGGGYGYNSSAYFNSVRIMGYTTVNIGGGFAYLKNNGQQRIGQDGQNNDGGSLNLALHITGGGRLFMDGGEINIASDIRIKKNIEYLDGEFSLNCIRKIKPVYFNYIKTNSPEVGFIAQQVEEFIPEAVSNMEGFLPNILSYGNIEKIDIDTYKVVLHKNIDISNVELPVGIKLTKNDTENIICGIMEINDDQSLLIKGNIDDVIDNNQIYVYGTYVSDFRSITKNVILTYAVEAIKQLDLELQQVKKEKISEIEKMKSDFKTLNDELQELKDFLKKNFSYPV